MGALTPSRELLAISLVLAVGGLVPSPWIALLGLASFLTYLSSWPAPRSSRPTQASTVPTIRAAGRFE